MWQRFKSLFTGQENKGATIETSIDPKIQQAAYNGLSNNDGAAVAIEVKTGRVLAMVSTPSYDPNQLASHDTSEAKWRNYGVLVPGRHEPDAQPRHLAALSSGIHVQDGGGGRCVGNGRISDRH